MEFGIPQLIGILTAAAGFVGAIAALMAALLTSTTVGAQVSGVLIALAILVFSIAVLILALKNEPKS